MSAVATLARKLVDLPEAQRVVAEGLLEKALAQARKKGGAGFDPERFAAYARAQDPVRFAREVFGVDLFPKQREALHRLLASDRVILCSCTNWGKSLVLMIAALYQWLCVGSLPDPSTGEPQGGILVLTGPSATTVLDTAYGKILELVRRGEARGIVFPGGRSELQVQWNIVAGRWFIRLVCPPKSAGGRGVAETAQGRHHRNLVVAIEEARTLDAALMRALDGMATSEGNRIWGCLNPNDSRGIVHARIQSGELEAHYYSAFDHPNVVERRAVVGDGHALAHTMIESTIRHRCHAVGPYPETPLDPGKLQFLYAMPDPAWPDAPGHRADGIPGHPLARPMVWQPRAEHLHQFAGQVLGVFPPTSPHALFRDDQWEAVVERWRTTRQPHRVPDRVGIDASGLGKDQTVVTPVWGPSGRDALQSLKHGITTGFGHQLPWVGEPEVAPKGEPTVVARWIVERFGTDPVFYVDRGHGEGLIAALEHRHGCKVRGVSFGGTPNAPLPGQEIPRDVRTEMALVLRDLVRAGAVALPDKSALREEAFALELRVRDEMPPKTIPNRDRQPVVKLIDKDEVRERIGRSTDDFDSVCLALHEAVELNPPRVVHGTYWSW